MSYTWILLSKLSTFILQYPITQNYFLIPTNIFFHFLLLNNETLKKKHEKLFQFLKKKKEKKDFRWLWMINKIYWMNYMSLKHTCTRVTNLLITLPDNNTNPISVFSLQSDSLPWQIFSNSIKSFLCDLNSSSAYEWSWLIHMSESYLCLTTIVKLRCIGIFSGPLINITGGKL